MIKGCSLRSFLLAIGLEFLRRGVSVMDNVLDYDGVVCKFEFQLCYCVHFWTNTIEEMYEPPYLSLHSTISVLLQG